MADYPCRCGQTHTGDYAYEDWNHHMCFHDEEMWAFWKDASQGEIMVVCSICGNSWLLPIPEGVTVTVREEGRV